jgi:hypothetical protein
LAAHRREPHIYAFENNQKMSNGDGDSQKNKLLDKKNVYRSLTKADQVPEKQRPESAALVDFPVLLPLPMSDSKAEKP